MCTAVHYPIVHSTTLYCILLVLFCVLSPPCGLLLLVSCCKRGREEGEKERERGGGGESEREREIKREGIGLLLSVSRSNCRHGGGAGGRGRGGPGEGHAPHTVVAGPAGQEGAADASE